jgi:membrane-bound lytic murein transglycosylase B
LEWWEYRNLFINDLSVNRGVEFWNQHQKSLENAHKKYGVPPSVIVGILGVETRYGRLRGGFRVIDALSTLSFHYPRRAPFFQAQLKAFLILSREQKFDPLVLTGSYAGAMGIPQFMPTATVIITGDDIEIFQRQPVFRRIFTAQLQAPHL